MRRIAAPLGLTSVWLTIAMVLSVGLPLVQAEHQSGSQDRSAQPIILPPLQSFGFLFVVTSTGDGANVGTGGVCDDGTGNCTLRAAIQAANNTNGTDDTIQFNIPTTDPGFDAQTAAWTINLGTALPDLSSNVTINGPGADKLTVKRSDSAAPFRIFTVTTTGAVTFAGMTISNGVGGSNASQPGGGIDNIGTGQLNVNNCTISGNAASSGGGIASLGQVNITGSTFANNVAIFGGGGIACGFAVISESTFSGNSSATGDGGAITTGNTVSISNCTFSNNSGIAGAAIANGAGTMTLTNSTFNGNSSARDGGGAIANVAGMGAMNVANCTVIGNHLVNSPNGGAGGVFNTVGATMTVESTIIALNTATGFNVVPDVDGSFFSGGFNLIGIKDGSTGFSAPTDHVGTAALPLDPMLSPTGLQSNGGSTKTIALLAGSPAVNAGAPDAPPNDQRGFFRNGLPDIGAYEFGGDFFPVTLGNISTRGLVGIGDQVMIGGFIVSGTGNKLVLLRAKGPSLSESPFNLANTLQDPTLSLFSGATRIGINDNWADAANAQSIDPALRPTNGLESAILVSLAPGAYTAIASGADGGTGIGLVEVFDMDAGAQSKLSNISTRGLVGTGDDVMIGGFIVNGPNSEKVVVRAIGPSLANAPFNLTNVLQNPTLSLFDANGGRFATNDDWRSTQEADIIATGLQPSNDSESVVVTTLVPGNYTAIVSGVGGTTGLALVEVYGVN